MFPLHTTSQSEAYKQQLKVTSLWPRNKAVYYMSELMFISSNSRSRKPSLHTSTSTGKIMMDSIRPINSMNSKSTNIAMIQRPRGTGTLTRRMRNKPNKPMSSLWQQTKSMVGDSPSMIWPLSTAWSRNSMRNCSWLSRALSKTKNDRNFTLWTHFYTFQGRLKKMA